MNTITCEALLEAIATAASQRQPLPEALRASRIAGAEALALRLEAGEDLAAACAGLIPPELVQLIAGPRPRLEHAALLGAAILRDRRGARGRLFDLIAWPVVCLGATVAALITVAGPLGLPLDHRWWPVVIFALVLALAPLLALVSENLAARLPWLCGWHLHAQRAWRYERAALAASWRLDEMALDLLGTDLRRLGPVLARPDAEIHCRRLAAWHRQAGERAQRRLGLVLATALLVMGGALLLTAAGGPIRAGLDEVMQAAEP
jgi:hypothetical protein